MSLHGILPVDKPYGITSHDVVARIRRLSGQKRVGHAGTLDPMATGVLVVCLGEATRLSDLLMDGTKSYLARVTLGASTDTDDAMGTVLAQTTCAFTEETLDHALARQVGDLMQMPPAYSAIKQRGVPSYKKARAGGDVSLPPRPVTVYRMVRLSGRMGHGGAAQESPPSRTIDLLIQCGKGTYIRSIARDLGADLGCGAHLSGLCRISSGNITIDQCATLPMLEASVHASGPMALRGWLKDGYHAIAGFPLVVFDENNLGRVRNGMHVDVPGDMAPGNLGVYGATGRLAALAAATSQGPAMARIQPAKVFGQAGA